MGKLNPLRHKQEDLFVCDILDATPKDDIGSMEHPMFTLSKKPDKRLRHYEHNGEYIKIKPSFHGLATIFDKDILIYAISQLIAGINAGEEPCKTIRLKAYDLLYTTNRPLGGSSYERLKAAFSRLEGTRIETCIRTGGKEITSGFGMIDSWDIVRPDRKGRMEAIDITLSDWLYNAILDKEVLTISRDYFRIGKPIERRIYELCRKHCGKQKKWEIGLDLLRKKSGSSATCPEFRRKVNDIIQSDHLPEYKIGWSDGKREKLVVRPRNYAPEPEIKILLKSETYTKAGDLLTGTPYDKYALEREWLHYWEKSGKPEFKASPDAAFLGFCRHRRDSGFEEFFRD